MGSLGTFSKRFLLLSALILASPFWNVEVQSAGIIDYADNLLSSNCTSGNYSIANRNCSGSDGNAYRTIEAAASGLGAGDIVNIRESGTVYTGSGGESSILLSQIGTGTSSNHLIIQKYPDDSGTVYLQEVGDGGSLTSPKNVTVRNVTINCGNFTVPNGEINGSVGIGNVHGGRFENVVVEHCWSMGIQFVGQSEFINMTVRFNGFGLQDDPVSPAGGYGVYTGTAIYAPPRSYDGNLFDGGRYHNNAGYGIHCYADCGNTIFRNLRIDHNGTVGIIMAFKAGSQISNVVADNNGSTGIWLAGNGLVGYNLSAYNNGGADIMVSTYSNITVRDSIALNGIGDDGLGYTSSNNITSGSASTYFVDAANENFQLTPTSTALGVGADVTALQYERYRHSPTSGKRSPRLVGVKR